MKPNYKRKKIKRIVTHILFAFERLCLPVLQMAASQTTFKLKEGKHEFSHALHAQNGGFQKAKILG